MIIERGLCKNYNITLYFNKILITTNNYPIDIKNIA